MTGRETIKTLLDKDLPDRIGLNEQFWPFLLENAWEEQGVSLETDMVEYFDLDIRNIYWQDLGDPCPDMVKIVEESDDWIVKSDGWGACK